MENADGGTVLSKEETDNLARSTKKQKPSLVEGSVENSRSMEYVSQSDMVVKETQLLENSSSPSPATVSKELFPTATGMKLTRNLISYKDICMGTNGGVNSDSSTPEGSDNSSSDSEDDETSEEEDSEDSEDESYLASCDPLCPLVKITREEKKSLCVPWKKTLIVKLLGKRIGMKMLQNRLSKLWQPSSGFDIIDMENDYFFVIQKGRPDFFPFEDKPNRVADWVRIPGLPVEYYDRKILGRIGNTIGHTIKIDSNTLREKVGGIEELFTERAKFARLCVEVDLQKMLISHFVMNGRHYKVEYEEYQPEDDSAPIVNQVNTEVDQSTPEEDSGPWMLVQRNARRPARNQGGTGGRQPQIKGSSDLIGDKKGSGSRFDILQDTPISADNQVVPIFQDNDRSKGKVVTDQSGSEKIILPSKTGVVSRKTTPRVNPHQGKKSTPNDKPPSVAINSGTMPAVKTIANASTPKSLEHGKGVRSRTSLKSASRVKRRVELHTNSREPLSVNLLLDSALLGPGDTSVTKKMDSGHDNLEALLDNEGQLVTNVTDLKNITVSFFTNLFAVEGPISSWPIRNAFPSLHDDVICSLSAPFTREDIRGAVFSMDLHILRDCPRVKEVWALISDGNLPAEFNSSSLHDWIFRNISLKEFYGRGGVWNVSTVFHHIVRTVEEFNSCQDKPSLLRRDSSKSVTRFIRWPPPTDNCLKWNLDGSVSAREGHAASGGVLRDGAGRWITGLVRNIGFTSITVAELWAFKDASQFSHQRGHTNVWFESDSLTAVNFINNGVPPPHPCYGIVTAVRNNISRIPHVRI
ncbi:Ribonuclease H-like superfamily [Sesbania bispinosa]|nr:Ribonuclease H-like superfamily [Sesbania bispinosa]